MGKVDIVKATPEDTIVFYKDDAGFLLRRFEVNKDNTCTVHNIRLDGKEAEQLVKFLQESSKEGCDRVKQEQEMEDARVRLHNALPEDLTGGRKP